MVLKGTSSAEMASSEMAQLKHQMAIAGNKAGFVTYRTTSENSLGSLGSYNKNWNLADTEVTSKLSEPSKLVAVPGTISRKLATAKKVLQDATTEAQVNSLLFSDFIIKHHMYIHPVPEIRVEFTRLESLETLDENFAILNHLFFLLTAHSGEPCQAVLETTSGA